MPPLLVIDGDSLGHRAYHAMPHVEGAGGRPVGLLVGFANFLLATWRSTQPRAVIVCLDTRVPSYRHDLLPGYHPLWVGPVGRSAIRSPTISASSSTACRR